MEHKLSIKIKDENNITYCSKCLSVLIETETIVKDHNGDVFCDAECRREYYAENNKETNARFDEWVGRD